MQVVTQIGPVLDLEFPAGIESIIKALKPFAIDLQSLLQMDCITDGAFGFYEIWIVRVLVIPVALMGLVGLQYAYERRRVDSSTALGYFKANTFVVVFLCYPGVCNQAFSMFNCRDLDGDLSVLVKDYSVTCSTERHRLFQFFAGIYIGCVSLGIPMYMVALMVRLANLVESFSEPAGLVFLISRNGK